MKYLVLIGQPHMPESFWEHHYFETEMEAKMFALNVAKARFSDLSMEDKEKVTFDLEAFMPPIKKIEGEENESES